MLWKLKFVKIYKYLFEDARIISYVKKVLISLIVVKKST